MGGGDNLAVGWSLPDGSLERPISGTRLSPAITGATSRVAVISGASKTVDNEAKAVLYPNPAKDKVTVEFATERAGEAKITVSDVLSREYIVSTESIYSGYSQVTLDVSDLESGMYLITVKAEGKKWVEKIQIKK